MNNPIDSAATLERINQDKDLLAELLTLFIQELPIWHQKLNSVREPVVFAQHIHQIKGICQYLTMPKLALLIGEAEQVLKQPNTNVTILVEYSQKISNELKCIAQYYHEHIHPPQ